MLSLVISNAVNIETRIEINNVTANPTMEVPPKIHITIAPISVVTLLSITATAALLKPREIGPPWLVILPSLPRWGFRNKLSLPRSPDLYSSLIRSKIIMFASTAIPIR